ncbi:site-specific integrase [Ochrobactrum intermedium]|uniref:site-specific integrase n=1 Tax=Brucella intermedia TaxID=94625 RepID=UPI00159CB45F|nr:site-specific integrase [Brucella intermedia]NVM41244.1 site-specific integrase [Brucella intermedia]
MRKIDGLHSNNELPDLPEESSSLDGVIFYPRQDVWLLYGTTVSQQFNFVKFEHLASNIILNLRWITLINLKEKSFSHARNQFLNFWLFYRVAILEGAGSVERIELSHIISFKKYLGEAGQWKLGLLRILLNRMEKLGFGISSQEAIEFLAASKIRGNTKGTSIRTRDPKTGAFSDTELLIIQSALNNAYADRLIGLENFAMAWLFLAYGCRAIQIATMKENDLLISENSGGKSYALRVPRAKQRGQLARSSFNTRYCNKQIGALLEKIIERNAVRRAELKLDPGEAPLFISRDEGQVANLPYHYLSNNIGQRIDDVIERITGLKGNAKRFRITLAQRAVDDGKDQFTVAELLDHSDTQNVGVYYEASPAMVPRLDRRLAMELAPLAQAFSGVMVATEADASRGDDRSSRIYDRTLADNIDDPLGTCGQMSFCGLAAPFACYTCRHFQAWIDGPHEQFLTALLADRERMEMEGISPKIFTIRDRTIRAAAEIVHLCSIAKAEADGVTQ